MSTLMAGFGGLIANISGRKDGEKGKSLDAELVEADPPEPTALDRAMDAAIEARAQADSEADKGPRVTIARGKGARSTFGRRREVRH